jgi:uncharacterized protein YgiM (DUF1202 family)
MANYFDKYKYVKFNDIYIEDICEIQDISEPLLTSLDIDTLNIKTVDGETFNGCKKNAFTIELELLIDCDTQEEYDEKLQLLKDVFDVDEPKAFFKNEDKFIMAIPSEGIEPQEKYALYSREFKVNLLCLSPYYYSKDLTIIQSDDEGNNQNYMFVNNNGKKPVNPLISIGISQDTHFVQLENVKTGEKMLIGKYPKISLVNQKVSNTVIYNECETTTNFIDTTASLDSDRSGGGSIAVTKSGKGICMNNPGDGNTTWKGVAKRLQLDETVDEFELKINMSHNSTGKSGDPTDQIPPTDTETVISGKKETYYECTANNLNVRSGAGTKYKKIGSVKKGYQIFKGTPTKGWVKFEYPKIGSGSYGYCSTKYLTKKVKDSTVTTYKKNFVVYTTDKGYTGANLRSSPNGKSKVVCSIPYGSVVRCNTKEYKDPTSSNRVYYKLATKYNGKYDGYIAKGNLIESSKATVEYAETFDTSDDKMGMIEVYGFDINGKKLFKVGMYDDNPYYEYTYPLAEIGGKVVLKDTTTVPKPNVKYETSGTDDDITIKVTNKLSGRLGSWNEFWGTWTIRREKVSGKYQWTVRVSKNVEGIITKTQASTNLKSSSYPTEQLAYIVVYMGTNGTMEKASSVALTHVECKKLNTKTEIELNHIYFEQGDIIEIDGDGDRTVYLNEEPRNDLLDIGSRFFKFRPGQERLRIKSDDKNLHTSVIFREKY